jgi:hypothetical protein
MITVRPHTRRRPHEAEYNLVHSELRRAFERDMELEELRYLIEVEVEKDLREERR